MIPADPVVHLGQSNRNCTDSQPPGPISAVHAFLRERTEWLVKLLDGSDEVLRCNPASLVPIEDLSNVDGEFGQWRSIENARKLQQQREIYREWKRQQPTRMETHGISYGESEPALLRSMETFPQPQRESYGESEGQPQRSMEARGISHEELEPPLQRSMETFPQPQRSMQARDISYEESEPPLQRSMDTLPQQQRESDEELDSEQQLQRDREDLEEEVLQQWLIDNQGSRSPQGHDEGDDPPPYPIWDGMENVLQGDDESEVLPPYTETEGWQLLEDGQLLENWQLFQ